MDQKYEIFMEKQKLWVLFLWWSRATTNFTIIITETFSKRKNKYRVSQKEETNCMTQHIFLP